MNLLNFKKWLLFLFYILLHWVCLFGAKLDWISNLIKVSIEMYLQAPSKTLNIMGTISKILKTVWSFFEKDKPIGIYNKYSLPDRAKFSTRARSWDILLWRGEYIHNSKLFSYYHCLSMKWINQNITFNQKCRDYYENCSFFLYAL